MLFKFSKKKKKIKLPLNFESRVFRTEIKHYSDIWIHFLVNFIIEVGN